MFLREGRSSDDAFSSHAIVNAKKDHRELLGCVTYLKEAREDVFC
jgi:hypothetical protein